jgi:hypothetical protein
MVIVQRRSCCTFVQLLQKCVFRLGCSLVGGTGSSEHVSSYQSWLPCMERPLTHVQLQGTLQHVYSMLVWDSFPVFA